MKSESAVRVQSEEAPACHGVEPASKAPGGGRGRHHAGGGEKRQPRGKFCSKKGMEMRPLSERELRERAERERKHEESLAEWGVSEKDLLRWRRHALAARRLKRDDPVWLKRYGREAVVEAVGDEEHCRDLAGEHARESACRSGDLIGSVRDRYEKIVEELLAARYVQRDGRRYSLSSVLLRECGSDEATEELLQHLGIWIQRFTLSYYMYKLLHNSWVMPGSGVRAIRTLRGRSVSEGLMKALAIEHARDPLALKAFLRAVFERWRKPRLQQRLLMHQIVGSSKEIAFALQEMGVAPRSTTERQLRAAADWVRKNRERDKEAAKHRLVGL
jgi:hypothetical protein